MTENSISGGQFEGTVVMAHTVHLQQNAPAHHRVRMLAQPVSRFVNRTAVLERLDAVHRERADSGTPTIFVMSGVGGIGKTETALHWIHRHRKHFTGHQFYANLSPQGLGAPREPAAVLEQFLAELGVAKEDRPHGLEALAARFRSLTSQGPVVVLLDNAVSAAQTRMLMPGSEQGVLLVTSRLRLAGLRGTHNAELVLLRPLTDYDSEDLLGPAGAAADVHEHRKAVLRACAGLPLAVRIAAARIDDAIPGSLSEFAAQLADRQTRLNALAVPDDVSVKDIFDVSYQGLAADHARLYRLLGLHPTSTLDLAAAQALAGGLETDQLKAGMRALVDASLLTKPGPDRFVMHDLVHDHALACADQSEPAAEREGALDRLLDHYLTIAIAADSAISGRWRYEPEPHPTALTPTALTPTAFDNAEQAVQAIAGRRETFQALVHLAVREGRNNQGWQLGQALWGYYLRTGSHNDWVDNHTAALECAMRSDDLLAVARMQYQLGFAHLQRAAAQDDDAQALDHLTQALSLARELNHHRTQSTALECLGLLALRQGDARTALDRFTSALEALADVDHPRGRAILASHRGRALTAVGDHATAARQLLDAHDLFAALTDPHNPELKRPDLYNQARCLRHYADNQRRAGLAADACQALQTAADLMRGQGADPQLADIHLLHGTVRTEMGDHPGAVRQYRTALELLEAIGDPRVPEVQGRLAESQAHVEREHRSEEAQQEER
ncbi:tetratricopeptide (TPR) repeat protein [Kitasatospora sp. MAA4]|uniref:NB-ARC domain-containing protein n=1 Tax=Kitasatospora sp. MAA4 TaxID=3035093 RepID=UPI002476E8BD|nr:NB-ARC domain-containing protein [Kitasatospora sp. MAA4]MDH6136806.1 tetratricopeptide (TPR) repeat protein [Kitasatospora sp. MAA4]